jgi:hypothetical protein
MMEGVNLTKIFGKHMYKYDSVASLYNYYMLIKF